MLFSFDSAGKRTSATAKQKKTKFQNIDLSIQINKQTEESEYLPRLKMTQIDELFVEIAKFVLKKTDFSFARAQTMIKSHTEKLSETGDVGFPTTIQPWLNIIENPSDLRKQKQLINESDEEFAQKLIEASTSWTLPIQAIKMKQFRCLLFLDRPKCYNGILKTVLYDDAIYGQWHRINDKIIYAVQLVNQSYDKSLVEHRCKLVAKVLTNLLQASGFQMASNVGEHKIDPENVIDILVSCARRDDPQRLNRQREIEVNNNSKSRLIVCGSVIMKSGLTADDFIR